MTVDTTDWTELREFRGIDLTQSFVLSWLRESSSLLIDIDLLLLPEHVFYEKPRPAEKACYRPALIEFPHCDSVADGKDEIGASAIGRLGGGKIAGLRRIGEGVYEIGGDFGTVRITAERPMIRMKNQRP